MMIMMMSRLMMMSFYGINNDEDETILHFYKVNDEDAPLLLGAVDRLSLVEHCNCEVLRKMIIMIVIIVIIIMIIMVNMTIAIIIMIITEMN